MVNTACIEPCWIERCCIERWPLREPFTIARGSKTEAVVVVVTVTDGEARGRGEALPYARYGEDPEEVRATIMTAGAAAPLTRASLRRRLPPGAARNALDLALFDLEAKRTGEPAWRIAGLGPPAPTPITYTLPIRDPETTRELAARHAHRPLLKLKVGGRDDLARLRAAREGAPESRFVIDANEGWDLSTLTRLLPALVELGVELIEQPLPAAADGGLLGIDSPIPLCADESFHGEASELDALRARYRAVNIKLDKAGGLTAALESVARARELGLLVLVGSMVATSLAVAPAVLLAQGAEWADLDAPLFLTEDRTPGLRFEGAFVHPPTPELWG